MTREYTIIDVDTHITEPADTWTSRVPAKFRDDVPHVVWEDKAQRECWHMQGKRVASVGLTAVAGWDRGPFPSAPSGYSEMLPAAYDSKERLKYLDEVGIWAQVLYPNVGGFGSQIFLGLEDSGLQLACVEAYNDFQTEWASADSRRLLPVTATPFWDIDETVREIRRCHAMGHRAILFTGEPQTHGQPYLGDAHWNPLWEVSCELEMPISFHIGSGDFGKIFSKDRVAAHGWAATYANSTVSLILGNGMQVGDLLLSGVLPRYPELKVASVESGVAWVPMVLEASDYAFKDGQVRLEKPEYGDMLPSDYFRRQVYVCYWFEEFAPRNMLDVIGEDHLMFETDFPHPTSLYKEVVHERIEASLGGHDAATRKKILWDNGRDLYKVEEPTAADTAKLNATTAAV